MIFSFLSTPITLSDLTKEIAYFLNISETEAENLIKPFINNEEENVTKYDEVGKSGLALNHYTAEAILIKLNSRGLLSTR